MRGKKVVKGPFLLYIDIKAPNGLYNSLKFLGTAINKESNSQYKKSRKADI